MPFLLVIKMSDYSHAERAFVEAERKWAESGRRLAEEKINRLRNSR